MSLTALSGPSNRSLLLVHGRDFKPGLEAYMDLSMSAMRAGIERDYPTQVESFDLLQKHVAWYGDLSLIHISEPTRPPLLSRMPSSA